MRFILVCHTIGSLKSNELFLYEKNNKSEDVNQTLFGVNSKISNGKIVKY